MSYDVYLKSPPVLNAVDVGNSTSNHAPAWTKALGFPLENLDGARAGDCSEALWTAAQTIRRNPERYDELVRGDGSWGTWDSAAEFLETFARACDRHPNTTVDISN